MLESEPWDESAHRLIEEITRRAASLPPEALAAAEARGRARELFSTAAELLDIFQTLP